MTTEQVTKHLTYNNISVSVIGVLVSIILYFGKTNYEQINAHGVKIDTISNHIQRIDDKMNNINDQSCTFSKNFKCIATHQGIQDDAINRLNYKNFGNSTCFHGTNDCTITNDGE